MYIHKHDRFTPPTPITDQIAQLTTETIGHVQRTPTSRTKTETLTGRHRETSSETVQRRGKVRKSARWSLSDRQRRLPGSARIGRALQRLTAVVLPEGARSVAPDDGDVSNRSSGAHVPRARRLRSAALLEAGFGRGSWWGVSGKGAADRLRTPARENAEPTTVATKICRDTVAKRRRDYGHWRGGCCCWFFERFCWKFFYFGCCFDWTFGFGWIVSLKFLYFFFIKIENEIIFFRYVWG